MSRCKSTACRRCAGTCRTAATTEASVSVGSIRFSPYRGEDIDGETTDSQLDLGPIHDREVSGAEMIQIHA